MLAFSWFFVDTCKHCHPMKGPQEALWNMIKQFVVLIKGSVSDPHSFNPDPNPA
jgi:hypothetical protein